MSRIPRDPFGVRILKELVRLRASSALKLVETAPGSRVWRYSFRAAGQPVSCDLDTTALELRCYHHRDEVAMVHLPVGVMDVLTGRRNAPEDVPVASEAEIVADLRSVIADWREGNPRIYMSPPVKAGHPDNWNGA